MPCPFLVPVVADRLWLNPVVGYCRRPDCRIRVPARSTALRICGTPEYLTCAGYCESAALRPSRPRPARTRPRG